MISGAVGQGTFNQATDVTGEIYEITGTVSEKTAQVAAQLKPERNKGIKGTAKTRKKQQNQGHS